MRLCNENGMLRRVSRRRRYQRLDGDVGHLTGVFGIAFRKDRRSRIDRFDASNARSPRFSDCSGNRPARLLAAMTTVAVDQRSGTTFSTGLRAAEVTSGGLYVGGVKWRADLQWRVEYPSGSLPASFRGSVPFTPARPRTTLAAASWTFAPCIKPHLVNEPYPPSPLSRLSDWVERRW